MFSRVLSSDFQVLPQEAKKRYQDKLYINMLQIGPLTNYSYAKVPIAIYQWVD